MLTCKEVTEPVTDYLEGRLSIGQRVSFHMHLGMCRHCRAYLRQMKMTVRTLGHLPEEPTPAAVRDELLARFRAMRPAQVSPSSERTWSQKTVALVESGIGGRRGWAILAGLLGIALVWALASAMHGAHSPACWHQCLYMEVGAGLLPLAALALVARVSRATLSVSAFATVAAGGAFAAFAFLSVTCPASRIMPHLLMVHVGGIVLAATLGVASSRLVAARSWS